MNFKSKMFLSAVVLIIGIIGAVSGAAMLASEGSGDNGWEFIIVNGALTILAAAYMLFTWLKRRK